MLFKGLFLFLLSCLFLQKIRAQAEFAPGYIINTKHDTLWGEIKVNLKNQTECFAKIYFRTKCDTSLSHGKPSPTRSYQANKIDGFGFEGNNYSSVKLDNHWVFMITHCQGKICLFEYKAPVSSGNEKMESEYYVMKGGFENLQIIAMDSKLKKHMKPFVSDDKILWKDFEKNNFDFGVVMQLISNYNERNK